MRKVEFVVGGDVENVVVKKEGVKGGPEGVDVRGEEGGSVGDVVRGVSSEGRSGVEGRSESSDLVKGEGSPHWSSSSSSSDAVDTCERVVTVHVHVDIYMYMYILVHAICLCLCTCI